MLPRCGGQRAIEAQMVRMLEAAMPAIQEEEEEAHTRLQADLIEEIWARTNVFQH